MRVASFRLSLFVFVILFGCVPGFLTTVEAENTESRKPSPAEPWLKKARDYEKKGELQLALFNLRVSAKIDPAHQEIGRRIVKLIKKTETAASRHFRKGNVYFKRGNIKRAQKEFLVTLRYDPNHHKALYFLKNKLPRKRFSEYTVKKGDTFKKIARKAYQDNKKDFLVAHFNNLDPDTKPAVGIVVKLPVLEEKLEQGDIDTKKELQRAIKYFDARKYEKVLPIVNNILKYNPAHGQADEMKNVSYYQLGKQLHQKKEYSKSLRMYNFVDPEYKIVETAMAKVRKSMHAEAEDHYRKGIKHFVNEKFRAAILEWSRTLTLNPDHEKAKNDMERARKLLKKLEETE